MNEATTAIRLNLQRAQLQGNNETGEEGLLRDQYRFYLSVFLERICKSYGAVGLDPVYEGTFPCFIWLEKGEDRWKGYYVYVRHLIESVDGYAHLRYFGFPLLDPTFRLTMRLSRLLNSIERVIGIHDGVMDSQDKGCVIDFVEHLGHHNEHFRVSAQCLERPVISRLVTALEEVRSTWHAWGKSIR